jgi:hypothetical protein
MMFGKKFEFKDTASVRQFCGADEKGTGKTNEPNNIFGGGGGVPFHAPVRYQFDVDGAGKPEVHRKGRAT